MNCDEDEQLDWGSDDDYLNDVIAEAAGFQPKSSWSNDYSDGDPMDSVAYDGIAPQVSFLSIGFIGSLIIESQQGQFYGRLGRVNTPDCICNIVANASLSAQNCSECEKCKQGAMGKTRSLVKDLLREKDQVEFIGDSGASATFTYDINDFAEYSKLDKSLEARTANKGVPLAIEGSGTVFLKTKVDGKDVTVRLNPVYYIPGLSMRLLSIGEWLQQGCKLIGTKLSMTIQQGRHTEITLVPRWPGDTIYWLTATIIRKQQSLVSMSTLYQVDYDLMH